MFELHLSSTAGENARAAAKFIADLSEARIQESGRFTIALSGGNSPARLYATLAAAPFAERVEWQRWHIFWSDERCVPSDHPQSNYKLAREALLRRVPVPDTQAHRVQGEWMPNAAANAYEEEVVAVLSGDKPLFDLILLGIGEDGHVASLFPGSEALRTKTRLVLAALAPDKKTHRITFTLPLINAARNVALLANDASKADVLARVMQPRQGDTRLPASMVRPKAGALHWFLTEEAASKLPGLGRGQ
jgi:6-phosphogluconolactonase